jgi:hypothetical protein
MQPDSSCRQMSARGTGAKRAILQRGMTLLHRGLAESDHVTFTQKEDGRLLDQGPIARPPKPHRDGRAGYAAHGPAQKNKTAR